ncbi:hypothetical protein GCK32_014172, partial [Trichostrongylus colubriformis]
PTGKCDFAKLLAFFVYYNLNFILFAFLCRTVPELYSIWQKNARKYVWMLSKFSVEMAISMTTLRDGYYVMLNCMR